jgi:hypothetical protein
MSALAMAFVYDSVSEFELVSLMVTVSGFVFATVSESGSGSTAKTQKDSKEAG